MNYIRKTWKIMKELIGKRQETTKFLPRYIKTNEVKSFD